MRLFDSPLAEGLAVSKGNDAGSGRPRPAGDLYGAPAEAREDEGQAPEDGPS